MPKTDPLYTETLTVRVTPETAELIDQRIPHVRPQKKRAEWLRDVVTEAAESLPKPKRQRQMGATND